MTGYKIACVAGVEGEGKGKDEHAKRGRRRRGGKEERRARKAQEDRGSPFSLPHSF